MIFIEKHIQEAMNDSIVEEATKYYGIKMEDISKLGGFENFIYEYKKDDCDYILRFVHSKHREYNQVLAELEFIDYLDHNGASVSTVVHSIYDNLVEKIKLKDSNYFTICAFTRAPGGKVQKEDLTDEFFIMFGEEVGKLHRLTKNYVPKHKRYEWYEENFIKIGKDNLEEKDNIIIEKLEKVVKSIQKLPKSIENYGLIHTDLHFGNMFYDNGKLTIFDWDDASYKHFVSDIAIIIFYLFAFTQNSRQIISEKTNRVLRLLLKGYVRECPFNADILAHLNEFLFLRTSILYVVIIAAGDDIHADFAKMYIEKYRDSIIDEIPFLDLEIALKGI